MNKLLFLFQNPDVINRRSYNYKMLDGKKELKFFFSSESTEELLKRFQENFAKYIGHDYAFATGSGFHSLHLIMDYLKPKKNDVSLLQSYICKQLPAIMSSYSKIKFVDIDSEFNLNFNETLRHSSKAKIIHAVHTYGKPFKIKELKEETGSKDKAIIEDCAHSLGSEYKNKKTGCFGDYSLYSLRKNLPIGYGGVVSSNDKKFADFIEKKKLEPVIQNRDFIGVTALSLRLISDFKRPYMLWDKSAVFSDKINKELPSRLALSVLLVQLKNMNKNVNENMDRAGFLSKKFLGQENIVIQKQRVNEKHCYTRFPVRITSNFNIDTAIAELQKQGFETGFYYWDDFVANMKLSNESQIHYPESLKAKNQCIPVGLQGLDKKDLEKLAEMLISFSGSRQ